MFVMGAMADAMANIVEQRPGFELHAGLRRQMVDRLELIEEHDAEFADVLGVLLIVIEAAAEGACSGKNLARFHIVAVWLLAGECVTGNFVQQAFADTDTGDDEAANIQVAAENGKNNGGDAHNVGAIAANAIRLHAGAQITLKNIGKALAKKRKIQCREAILTRAGGDGGERFGVAAESDTYFFGEIRAIGKTRFEKSADVTADLLALHRANNAVDAEGAHQTNGADGKLCSLHQGMIAKQAEFEAAAAEIDNTARLRFRPHRGRDRFPA